MKKEKKIKIGTCFMQGILSGSLITHVIVAVIFAVGNPAAITEITSNYIKHLGAGLLAALVFSMLSLVYEIESLNIGVRVVLHLAPALTVYFIIAWYMKWIPAGMDFSVVFLICMLMIISALLIWFGYFLYYRREAEKINERLEKQKDF